MSIINVCNYKKGNSMYDKFIRNNAPISDPMKHPHLSKVLKIDGMPELLKRLYPDLEAFSFEYCDSWPSWINIIRKNSNKPTPFFEISTANGGFGKLYDMVFSSNSKLSDLALRAPDGDRPDQFRIAFRVPVFGDNINIENIETELCNTTKIGNNCHFTHLTSNKLTAVGDNFRAEYLNAPNLKKFGDNFDVEFMEYNENITHPAQIKILTEKLKQLEEWHIPNFQQDIAKIQKLLANAEQKRDDLKKRIAACQQQKTR